ncbi:MAG: hypothetical protein ACYTF3_02715 [Planctomycetota bacterium]
MPVAVSVPASAKLKIEMREDNWAFGEIIGSPRVTAASAEF